MTKVGCGSVDRSKAQRLATVVLAVVLVGLGGYTLSDFLPSMAWAAIFAVGSWPLYSRARLAVPCGEHDIVMPLAFTFLVAMVFVIPVGVVSIQLGRETHLVMGWIHNARENGLPVPDFLPRLPLAGVALSGWWQENLADHVAMSGALERFEGGSAMLFGRNLGAQVTHRVTVFTFTIMTLFFLYRSGPELVRQMLAASAKTFGPSGERVGKQVVASIHGTIAGLVLVGLAEGVVMGMAYAVAGAPHPSLLGAFTGVAAMLPFAAPMAFGLAAVLLLAKGSVAAAIVIFAFGMAVLLLSDHIVRPVLIGGATKLPFLWVLFGILGGVETWGLLGLFMGPALMSALILLWREWIEPDSSVSAEAASKAATLVIP